jgi:hypothetical protein
MGVLWQVRDLGIGLCGCIVLVPQSLRVKPTPRKDREQVLALR